MNQDALKLLEDDLARRIAEIGLVFGVDRRMLERHGPGPSPMGRKVLDVERAYAAVRAIQEPGSSVERAWVLEAFAQRPCQDRVSLAIDLWGGVGTPPGPIMVAASSVLERLFNDGLLTLDNQGWYRLHPSVIASAAGEGDVENLLYLRLEEMKRRDSMDHVLALYVRSAEAAASNGRLHVTFPEYAAALDVPHAPFHAWLRACFPHRPSPCLPPGESYWLGGSGAR
mgnify:CR=1 FL=1|jgi:hypothetical protein